jgi:hypothetical protein
MSASDAIRAREAAKRPKPAVARKVERRTVEITVPQPVAEDVPTPEAVE